MSKATSAGKKGATNKKATKPSAHPSWVDMVKECIVAHPEDARMGVSRPIIKKFVKTKYKITMDASHASQLSRAIISGSEKGTFVLPKGLSGKVKLAPKAKADTIKELNKAEKENKKATKATPTVTKKSATPKKTLTTSAKHSNRPTVAKSQGGKSQSSKKPAAKAESKTVSKAKTQKPAKKLVGKEASNKKPSAAKTKPAAKKAVSKKSDSKKVAAKTAAAKAKKPASKGRVSAAAKKPASKSTKPASVSA